MKIKKSAFVLCLLSVATIAFAGAANAQTIKTQNSQTKITRNCPKRNVTCNQVSTSKQEHTTRGNSKLSNSNDIPPTLPNGQSIPLYDLYEEDDPVLNEDTNTPANTIRS